MDVKEAASGPRSLGAALGSQGHGRREAEWNPTLLAVCGREWSLTNPLALTLPELRPQACGDHHRTQRCFLIF